MATQKTRNPLGGARGASNRTGGYFTTGTPPVSIPTAGGTTATPTSSFPEQPTPMGGISGGSRGVATPVEETTGAPVATPNLAPGLTTLSNDAQTPGAGFVQNTPSSPGTLQDFSGAASGLSSVLAPAAIGMRSAGLYGFSSALGTAGKVAGVASDIGAQNYGKAMAGMGSLIPGPAGMAIGAGRAAYDVMKGEGIIGRNIEPGGMASRALGWANQGLMGSPTEDAQGFQRSGALTSPVFSPGNIVGTDLAPLGGGTYSPSGDTGAISSPVSSPVAPTSTTLAPMSSESSYSSGYRGTSGSSDNTPASSSSDGGGWNAGNRYADGGPVGYDQPVGLSMSGYADGGEIGSGPLLAMGYAEGGAMGGPGGLSRPGMGADTSPQMIEMRVNQMARNPQFRQKIMETLQPLMQSGELTPQEITMMGQIATASMQNPKLYPQLRQFVAAQGMTPLPPAYDPMTIVKILSVTRALEQSGGGMAAPGQGQPTPAGQVPPTSQAQMVNPTGGTDGGMLQGPGTGRSDSIGTQNLSTGGPVKVSNGEYVIPEHVVRAKGRDFFDALLRRYSEVPKSEA